MKTRLFFTFFALTLPAYAWAHPGHAAVGFISGLTHPFTGLDHILGMLAVGVWAARNSGMKRAIIPTAFVGGMIAGGLIGLQGILPSFLDSAIASSVLASALIITLSIRLPLFAQAGLAMFFAIWHGIAHGIELPTAMDPWRYVCGFIVATTLLLNVGLLLGSVLRHGNRDRYLGAGMSVLAASILFA